MPYQRKTKDVHIHPRLLEVLNRIANRSEVAKLLLKSKISKEDLVDDPIDYIAISKEECDKISSTKSSEISADMGETRCSAYMVKCLSQYNSELYGANAWNVFNTVKGKGFSLMENKPEWHYMQAITPEQIEQCRKEINDATA